MNLSIIIPVYNEEVLIKTCLDAILAQPYEQGDREILVVNDASTDGTLQVLKQYEGKKLIRLISFDNNRGRAFTRLAGAKEAKFDRLLFIDSRVTIGPNFFETFIKKEDAWMPGKIPHNENSIMERTLFLIRNTVYKDYYKNHYNEVYRLTLENFDSTPKGTTCLLICKKEFIEATNQISFKDPYVSEDTLLFLKLLENKKKLFRNPETTIFYHQRNSFTENLIHLYQRGPRFIDYYFGRNVIYSTFIILGLSWLTILLLLSSSSAIIPLLIITIFVFFIVILYISHDISDIPKLTIGLPFILVIFTLGLVKGLFVLGVKRLKKLNDQK